MKVHKVITLDYDIHKKLILEDNASRMINTMLAEHYKDFDKTDEEIINEVKDKIIEKAVKKAEFEKYNNPEHKAKVKTRMERAWEETYGSKEQSKTN